MIKGQRILQSNDSGAFLVKKVTIALFQNLNVICMDFQSTILSFLVTLYTQIEGCLSTFLRIIASDSHMCAPYVFFRRGGGQLVKPRKFLGEGGMLMGVQTVKINKGGLDWH